MWISETGATATVECALHDAQKLKAARYTPGYFLTEQELEDRERKAFEAGQSSIVLAERTSFNDYKNGRER